jgi:hypothetical protein
MADTVFVSAIFVLPFITKKVGHLYPPTGILVRSKTTNHLEKNIF